MRKEIERPLDKKQGTREDKGNGKKMRGKIRQKAFSSSLKNRLFHYFSIFFLRISSKMFAIRFWKIERPQCDASSGR